MFQAVPTPIIRSTQLYTQLQVLSTIAAAAGWYRPQFRLTHNTSLQQYWLTPEAVCTVVCS